MNFENIEIGKMVVIVDNENLYVENGDTGIIESIRERNSEYIITVKFLNNSDGTKFYQDCKISQIKYIDSAIELKKIKGIK